VLNEVSEALLDKLVPDYCLTPDRDASILFTSKKVARESAFIARPQPKKRGNEAHSKLACAAESMREAFSETKQNTVHLQWSTARNHARKQDSESSV